MEDILVIPKRNALGSQESMEKLQELLDEPQLIYPYLHLLAQRDYFRKRKLSEEKGIRSYQDQILLEKIKRRSNLTWNLTWGEFESYINEELPILVNEIVAIEFDKRIESILDSVRRITREEIQISSANDQQILIQDIEFDKARELVVDYLKENKIASLSELSETLKIDLSMLCDIIGELKEKGLIKEKEE